MTANFTLTCNTCNALYEVILRFDTPEPQSGLFNCVCCGDQIYSWADTYEVPGRINLNQEGGISGDQIQTCLDKLMNRQVEVYHRDNPDLRRAGVFLGSRLIPESTQVCWHLSGDQNFAQENRWLIRLASGTS